jgi:choline dehydrogenase-like flavoprotein
MRSLVAEFEMILVGAASAGALLVNRLSENSQLSVCVLEDGPKDTNFAVYVPVGIAALASMKSISWGFHTHAGNKLNEREMFGPRGTTLGDSSATNALC